MSTRGDADPDDLHIADPTQAAALAAVVYDSARATGLGPQRAHRLAAHVSDHLASRLRTRGLRLTITWASPDAKTAIEGSRRSYDPPAPDPA